jgi:CheY-like chemotaxis protein
VSSNLGEGSTFFIYLPAAATVLKQVSPEPWANQSTRSGKILIMDDEPMICEVAGALINSLGHQVDFAADGEEAFAKFRAALQSGNPFDAAILDLTIRGGLGGAETVKKLQSIDPGVKAVVSSGYADNAVVANYRDYGFAAILNKPYNLDGLRHVLHTVLDPDAQQIN